MKINFRCPLCVTNILLCTTFFWVNSSISQIPTSLEGKVDMLSASVPENKYSQEYFLELGPDVIPILIKKLAQSLSEGASPDGMHERVLMNKPPADQKRTKFQEGLVWMLGIALKHMSLTLHMRTIALNSLYQALKSPYDVVREDATYFVAYTTAAASASDHIIPLLNDPEEAVRDQATEMLIEIGDKSVADRMAQVSASRKQGLTAEQIAKDGSFRYGDEAVTKIRNKGH